MHKLEGCWWEYPENGDAGQVSFLELAPDGVPFYQDQGRSFSTEDKLISRCANQMVRLVPDQEKLRYYKKGHRQDILLTQLHGSGEWAFEFQAKTSQQPSTGHGSFRHINEQNIALSLIKSVLLQKETSPVLLKPCKALRNSDSPHNRSHDQQQITKHKTKKLLHGVIIAFANQC